MSSVVDARFWYAISRSQLRSMDPMATCVEDEMELLFKSIRAIVNYKTTILFLIKVKTFKLVGFE